jgi:hypothetical protein
VTNGRPEAIGRWSRAIRDVEVLEPWLTESHWDEHYWDDVAALVVDQIGTSGADHAGAVHALRSALATAFPGRPVAADDGLYRDDLERRFDRIATLALGPTSPSASA